MEGSKVPWLLRQNECLDPSQIGLEKSQLFIFPSVLAQNYMGYKQQKVYPESWV